MLPDSFSSDAIRHLVRHLVRHHNPLILKRPTPSDASRAGAGACAPMRVPAPAYRPGGVGGVGCVGCTCISMKKLKKVIRHHGVSLVSDCRRMSEAV